MTVATEADLEFVTGVKRIAEEVAAVHADEVDREARFPREAVDALREAGALAAWVPERVRRGRRLDPRDRAGLLRARAPLLGDRMVFAMHQIQVGTIVRHLDAAPWFETTCATCALTSA